MKNITFSINQYDSDGDSCDVCILLHLNNTFIVRLKNTEEFDGFIKQLGDMQDEVKESWNRENG